MSQLTKAAQVMIDADAGQPIEQRETAQGSPWQDSPTPGWNWSKYVYRVKTERLYFVIEDNLAAYRIYNSREAAELDLANQFSDYANIRITELQVKPVPA